MKLTVVAPYVGAWIETCRDARKSTWEESHPMWVRGLKPIYAHHDNRRRVSHPMWVRGLKRLRSSSASTPSRRTLCGCVD